MSLSRHHILLTLALVLLIFAGAVLGAQSLTQNPAVLSTIGELGYLGVFGLAIIAGLNTVVPLPAATLTPIFTAAGLAPIGIVAALALGTLLADALGFFLGRIGRTLLAQRQSPLLRFFTTLPQHHLTFILPIVFLYATLAPLPNELILIPLGLSGMRFRYLLLPLLLGGLIHQTLLVFGVTEVTRVLFS